MARNNVAERVAVLEAQVARLRVELERLNQPKDWRSAIGMFDGDEVMERIIENARKIREADRRKAYREFDRAHKKKPKVKV